MFCVQCGYIKADGQNVCQQCGYVMKDIIRSNPNSVIIPFPKLTHSLNEESLQHNHMETIPTLENIPSWRAELRTRVSQVKARRAAAMEMETPVEPVIDQDRPKISVLLPESKIGKNENVSKTESYSPEKDDDKEQNPIVAATLKRVKRASGSKIASIQVNQDIGSKIESANETINTPLMMTATARTGEALPSITAKIENQKELELLNTSFKFKPIADNVIPISSQISIQNNFKSSSPSGPETKTVARNEDISAIRPEIMERVKASIIDLIVILIPNILLWFIVGIANGNLIGLKVQIILLMAGILITGIYLFGTMTTSGQTFGMMRTGIHIINTRNGARPNPIQVFLRTIGSILGLIFFAIGFIWIIFDKDQRGLHEYISQTEVVYV